MADDDNAFRILMVGASGAGKTSLLTAMYDTLKKEFATHGCTFSPDPGTSGKLDEYRDLLAAYEDPDRPIVVNPTDEGPEGTKDLRRYRFGVRFPEEDSKKDHDLIIEFNDVPGGWFSSAAGGDDFHRVLRWADAMVVAIDATALMYDVPEGEKVGRYHRRFNRPTPITEAMQHAGVGAEAADGVGRRTRAVVYTLTKAETYCQTPQDEQRLKEKAIEAYAELTEYLESCGVEVYLTVAQTVGCLQLHRYEVGYDVKKGEVVLPVFRRIVGRKYSPKNCDVPLRLLFSHALKGKLEDLRSGYSDMFNTLIEWFGFRDSLLHLIEEVEEHDRKKYQVLATACEE